MTVLRFVVDTEVRLDTEEGSSSSGGKGGNEDKHRAGGDDEDNNNNNGYYSNSGRPTYILAMVAVRNLHGQV